MTVANALTRFSNRVQDYIRYRPGYPQAVMDCLRDEFGLRPQQVVADIGSGTGISTGLLLDNGHRVIAVEPNADMRAAAETRYGSNGAFQSVAAPAEATTLPDASVDWIVAAQAFHWFDVEKCRVEFRRILKRGGFVALLWNDRRDDTPFLRGYDALLKSTPSTTKRLTTATPKATGESSASLLRTHRLVGSSRITRTLTLTDFAVACCRRRTCRRRSILSSMK